MSYMLMSVVTTLVSLSVPPSTLSDITTNNNSNSQTHMEPEFPTLLSTFKAV